MSDERRSGLDRRRTPRRETGPGPRETGPGTSSHLRETGPGPSSREDAALAALDPGALAADVAAFLAVPSETGAELPALQWLAARAQALGLEPDLHEHDLAALRAHPDHPGEEAPREALHGLAVTLRGASGARLAIDGHVDVVPAGTEPWSHPHGALADDAVWGRGAVDMKGAVVCALHAQAALRRAGVTPAGDVVLLAVPSEEDGGLGTFAALERDDAFGACLIPEPTGWDVVCAQAGALTFTAELRGVATHAAERLHGTSAIDRYLPVHAALGELERTLNSDVEHPLMAALALPYPVVVGRLEAGEWSSSVPDRVRFEGRAPVRVGEDVASARAAVERAIGEAAAVTPGPDGQALPTPEIAWSGGQFAAAETDPEQPFAVLVRDALGDERGTPAQRGGVPWGADMRLFCARGIPCVMTGTPGIELAHAVDERIPVADLATLARLIVRVLCRWPG